MMIFSKTHALHFQILKLLILLIILSLEIIYQSTSPISSICQHVTIFFMYFLIQLFQLEHQLVLLLFLLINHSLKMIKRSLNILYLLFHRGCYPQALSVKIACHGEIKFGMSVLHSITQLFTSILFRKQSQKGEEIVIQKDSEIDVQNEFVYKGSTYNLKIIYQMNFSPNNFEMTYHRPIQNTLEFRRCLDCEEPHPSNINCKMLCHYCHEIHNKKDYIDNICPTLQDYSLSLQNKHSFTCRKCQGLGSFQKVVETKILESKNNYQIRKKKALADGLEQPSRKVISYKKQQIQQNCKQCQGKGKIYRMINCSCQQPRSRAFDLRQCRQCEGGIKINPEWLAYRSEPVINRNTFFCVICHCDVDVGQNKYVLDCGHEFHSDCVFTWFNSNNSKNCPVCRRVDFYIATIKFPKPITPTSQNQITSSIYDVFVRPMEIIGRNRRGSGRRQIDNYEYPSEYDEDW